MGKSKYKSPYRTSPSRPATRWLFWNQEKWAWEIIPIISLWLILLSCNCWDTNHLFFYIWQNTFPFYCLGQISPIFQADGVLGSNAPKCLCCCRMAQHWHREMDSTEPQVRMLHFPADWLVLSIPAISVFFQRTHLKGWNGYTLSAPGSLSANSCPESSVQHHKEMSLYES